MSDDAMKLRDVAATMTKKLAPLYGEREARAMTDISIEHIMGLSPVERVLKSDETVSGFRQGQLDAVTRRLLKEEPLQYILGETLFYGMRFAVNPAVLIPRPETEELVDMIVRHNDRSDLRVLDIGTGSGCIAIALARNLRFATVEGIDISDAALETARANATTLKANVTFSKSDALRLHLSPASPQWDIIVSNPPYISWHEKESMAKNVIDHEPQSALFVPDSDPLIFYTAIMNYGAKALRPGGKIYFEINPIFADDLTSKAHSIFPQAQVDILRDIHGKRRFATITTTPS